ncbi:ABC transporter ATP-binding protein [Paenibacillus sp. LHD-117]|uniref:ABC transporter ATP-binding protein n=1 Tax=Paenibacillus sp. LHD-117 TaxID=3071412 RepID=UPI0027DF12B1|nr:ABC transporter ATP-binding protein [Paenibacillus sp. LHD-117]MDQ6419085.1 ABC transporter ATP-binding protein [Paenibacillus sp. LHD-117]
MAENKANHSNSKRAVQTAAQAAGLPGSASGAAVLELDYVTKRIGGKTLVNGLSFQVGSGEIVGLLGPNGAGKTTTIRMIVGLISMSEGDIRIGGSSVRKQFESAIRHIGAIIENPEFYPYMSGMDNLKQFMRMEGGVSEARIREVSALVGLEDALHKKVKAYSLGMRQRLGIAQALLHKPKVLILDEPTNGLDPAGIREMRDYLKLIAEKEGIGILVSSHLLTEMELMCSRVVVIQEGKLLAVRTIKPDGSDESRQMSVSLEVTDAEQAAQHIAASSKAELQGNDADGGRLIVKLAREDIPAIVKRLTDAGIGIYRIEENKATLEDDFMKWTGGNRIA